MTETLEDYKNYVKSRLNPISEILANIAAGDFSKRLEIPPKEDEFSELYVGLDFMMEDLLEHLKEREVAESELKKHQEHLEEIVKKRTEEITKANKQLQNEITERKRTEEALRESEEKFRNLAEQSPNIIFIYKKGRIVYINEMCENMLGCKKDELYSPDLDIYTFIAPEYLKLVKTNFKKFLEGETVPPYDLSIITKEDKRIEIILALTLIKYEGEDSILGVATDITDRKQAEIALRENEEKYRNLVERANDGIAIIQDSIIKYVNPRLAEMLGYSVGDLIDKEISKFVIPKELPKVAGRYERRMKGEKVPAVYETKAYNKKGSVVDLELNAGLIQYGGQPADFVIVRDIVERKRAEEKLKKSEEMYRMIFENISDVIFSVDTNYNLINVTPSVERMVGIKPEDLAGKPFNALKFLSQESMKSTFKNLDRVLAGDQPPFTEYEFTARDGTKKFVEVKSTPTFKDGKIVGITGIARDVTERKNAEHKLRESEEMYRSLVKTLPDAVTMTDLEGNINYVSPRTLELHGFDNENELLGKSAFELIDPNEHEIAMKNLKKTLDVGFARNLEYSLKNKDGSTFIGVLNTALIRDAHGEPKSFIATTRDITERKQTEKQIKRSLDEKEVLLREVHHRVKNNIQVISSMLNLYSTHIKDEPYLNAIQDIQNRIKSMALIHEKLYQTKDVARVDFNEYIKDLVNSLFRFYGVNINKIKPKIEVEGVSLGLDAGVPCGLIINELVSNSLKHAFAEELQGNINIEMRPENETEVALIISDNGKGFPPDFDFKNTKTFGLQLVITLVEQLGGNIQLNKEGGAEFKVTFEKGKEEEGVVGYA